MDDDTSLAQDPHVLRIEADLEDIGRDAEQAAERLALRIAPVVVGMLALAVVAWLLGRRRAHNRG
ncbi:MAG: hypothetical protein FJW88_12475 [Actinobacteria bacterium]|nr:hypothetical protein [Actinomycetota bacterium]